MAINPISTPTQTLSQPLALQQAEANPNSDLAAIQANTMRRLEQQTAMQATMQNQLQSMGQEFNQAQFLAQLEARNLAELPPEAILELNGSPATLLQQPGSPALPPFPPPRRFRGFPPPGFPPPGFPPQGFPPPGRPFLVRRFPGGLPPEAIPVAPTTQTPTTPTTQAPTASGAQRVNDASKITIAQIDSFVTDRQGSNHGQEIAKTLREGGENPSLAGKISLLQYSIDSNGSFDQNLSRLTGDALEDVIRRVQAGEDIDAVNMSLQDYNASANTDRVRTLISQLTDMNVAVVVAAGNGGPNQVNQLTTPDAFVVQSATNGRLNNTSSRGNITGQASTTSFATAELSPQIAAMMNAGMTINQIRELAGIPPVS